MKGFMKKGTTLYFQTMSLAYKLAEPKKAADKCLKFFAVFYPSQGCHAKCERLRNIKGK